MEWEFGTFTLSKARAELTGPEGPVHLEKYPLDLLLLLVENADRVVTKDEIVETIWSGRFVSDSTISTAVKQIRRALGDSGSAQAFIKTIHGRGFRFVASFSAANPAIARTPEPKVFVPPRSGQAQPSLAVLRFQYLGSDASDSALADAIPAELITSLSRLRWAQVIARGSSFRFAPDDIRPQEIGEKLGARYLVAGSVEALGDSLTIFLELILAGTGELVWADRFPSRRAELFETRQAIVAAVIAAMEIELPKFEAAATRRLAPTEFDAWSHFHIGLHHMFRFNEASNIEAARHFHEAIALDPEFARAHSALSFTHWQVAFMQFGPNRDEALQKAVNWADQALAIDMNEPLANFCMGRAKWLEGDAEAGISWLERALAVNPNFAQCHYSLGMNRMLVGENDGSRNAVDQAMFLSPLDPLYYAMLGVRALTYMAEGKFDLAGQVGEEATRSPGSHFFISWIAAMAHELGGNRARAEANIRRTRSSRTGMSQDMFFRSFPITNPDLRQNLTGAMTRLGID